jgi:Peptidase family C25/Propeptide_C25/Abnormal spindle-like microcephaly-assoc'd, ASPM-SPD-2-Hydin
MKTKLTIVLLLLGLSLFAEWMPIENNTSRDIFEHRSSGLDETNIQFSLDGYETKFIEKNEVNYQKISYVNEGQFLEIGKPDLPRFTRLYAIPDEGTVRFDITSFEEEVITNIDIYPRQELQIESQPIRTTFTIDENYYRNGGVFPNQIVELGQPAIFRDIRLVAATINPFQYDPVKRELRIITNVEFSIISDRSSAGENVKNRSNGISRSFENLYKASIENYDEFRNSRDLVFQDPCYLFVYYDNDDVLEVLEYLADWKKKKGFEVHLASTADTGTTTNSIKNYIQTAYDMWQNPPEFVAILGDANGSNSIPTFFETYSGYGGEGDHPYSQLDGNDILADVITGRLSFGYISELETIVSKVLGYEMTPFVTTTDWYNRALMVGDPSSSGPSCVSTKQAIKEMIDYHSANIVSTEVYSGSYSSAMSSNLNTGISYFNYRGYLGMSNFDLSDINCLNNGKMLPFAVFMTCGTGSFASGTSRSEAFLRAGTSLNQKGAIGAIGTATWGTHTTFNNCVDSGIFWGIFSDKVYNPGGALLSGKMHLYKSFPGNPGNKVSIFSHWNTLMGDPGVELFTKTPQSILVEYPEEINVGTNYITVNVLNNFSQAVEDAWICISSDDNDDQFRAYTDSNGEAILEIEAAQIGVSNLTITGHNLIPHLGSLAIISAETYVNVESVNIDDDNDGTSAGNADGFINPGESIELAVGLKNFGTETATSVVASISSNTSFITITDTEETYGNIESGNTNLGDDDFDFTVDSNVLGGSEIQLDVHVEDGNGSEWSDYIFLPVAGANLHVNNYTVVGGNGVLDPGETAEIIVNLFNTGSIEAVDLSGFLTCANEDLIITDDEAEFENILPGETGNNDANRFEISADEGMINGTQIELYLNISNPNGFDQIISFIISIGTVLVTDPLGPDAYGYYAYDSNDIGYDAAPVYDWIEIDPTYGGAGTNLNLYDFGDTGDVEDVTLPFNIQFYGFTYNMITVCTNGWIAPGGSTQASFMNSKIPGPHGPSPMISPFWDDLKTSGGHICTYYNETEHIFIVEWSHLQSDWNNSEETFQAIIYDPEFYNTPTGDAEIVFQYETISNTSTGSYSGYSVEHGQYSTVGLEDQTGTVGLGYTYNNTYPTAAATLLNGLAIKFTTAGADLLEYSFISASDTQVNFGDVYIGEDLTETVTITNTGNADLEVYDITNNEAEFAVDITNFTLTPQQTIDLEITFTPDYEGTITDELVFDSNDPIHQNFTIELEGEGLIPISNDDVLIPTVTQVFQNHPNPFNPDTSIGFAIHETGNVMISIFNIKGEKVKTLLNENLPVGIHNVLWNGRDDVDKSVSSGVYFYRFESAKKVQLRKMLLIK